MILVDLAFSGTLAHAGRRWFMTVGNDFNRDKLIVSYTIARKPRACFVRRSQSVLKLIRSGQVRGVKLW